MLANLPSIYELLAKTYGFSVGDFPNPNALRERLKDIDFMKFNKILPQMIADVSKVCLFL